MITFEMVVEQVGVEGKTLQQWIERGWVLPERHGEDWVFDLTDVARARLIGELTGELSIDEASIPVVLSLLDQVYALRGLVKDIGAAVEELPEPARAALRDRLGG